MLVIGLFCVNFSINAQLAKDNKCKFLGNITTMGQIRSDYTSMWNQLTPENESKWGVIANKRVSSVDEALRSWNWGSCDKHYNECKQKGIMFKFHVLIWTSQYPSYLQNLSASEIKEQVEIWFDAVAVKYPDLEVMDVVNEACPGHAQYDDAAKAFKPKLVEALGGGGSTGYKWIAEAFKMARKRWPNCILIYNDYNTFYWNTNDYINLINSLKKEGAPIDAAGCQAHDLNDMSGSDFKNVLERIHNAIDMPIYITEYDIAQPDDNVQLTRYKEQFPIMWEADYVAGVTLWGYVYGSTWVNGSGLIKDGRERPALTWLREYMQTDAAKNAKSPFCGGKSNISATLELSTETIVVGDELKISVSASVREGKINHVDMFADDSLLVNKYIAPYEWTFVPDKAGVVTIKVVVFDESGNTLEKTAKLTVCDERKPYSGSAIELPGTLELEDFDKGCNGFAYSDSDDENEGDGKYREESGADIVKGNGGLAIGYTSAGEWMEYTVNVKSAGNYSFVADAASGSDNSGFHISLMNGGEEVELTGKLDVPNGGDWDTYTQIEGELSKSLEEGEQILRVTIDGSYVNIDKIVFSCTDCKEETTSVEGIYADEIVISPNPAKDFIEVKTDDFEYAEIIDLAGKIVKKSDEKVINISNVPVGSYIIKVYSINNPVISRIFVKMD